jgi:hypothetical protein
MELMRESFIAHLSAKFFPHFPRTEFFTTPPVYNSYMPHRSRDKKKIRTAIGAGNARNRNER